MKTLTLVIVLTLSLIGCAGGEYTDDNTPNTAVSPQADTATR